MMNKDLNEKISETKSSITDFEDIKSRNCQLIIENSSLMCKIDKLSNEIISLKENLNFARDLIKIKDAQTVITHGVSKDQKKDEFQDCLIIGDSMLKHVNYDWLLNKEGISIHTAQAYTIEELIQVLSEEKKHYKCIFFHTGTNNLKSNSIEEMITCTRETVDKGLKIADHVIISTIIPRYDDPMLNVKAQKFNTQIFECYMEHEDVRVNDNCNLSLRPDQVEKFFDEEDAVHLNDHGTRVFAHNIKVSIANTLGVRIIRSRNRSSSPNQSQYKKGKIRGHNKFRPSRNKYHFKHQDKGGG